MKINKRFDEIIKASLWDCLDDINLLDKGICHYIIFESNHNTFKNSDNGSYEYINQRLKGFFLSWKYYSGCYDYPIPAPKGYKVVDNNFHPAEDIFYESYYDDYITGEYGESRVQCVMYLLEELTKND